MMSRLIFAAGALAAVAMAFGVSHAEEPVASENLPAQTAGQKSPPAPATGAPAVNSPAPETPEGQALQKALSDMAAGASDEDKAEHAALVAFYQARAYAPLWLAADGALTPKASSAIAEIKRADEWGLDPQDFTLPARAEKGAPAAAPDPKGMAADEIGISLAVLKYGRYARGGRIMDPSEQLSSYLDRRPQLLEPKVILDGIAEAAEPDAYLRGLHPAHPQFEKLRQKYLAILGRYKPRGVAGRTRISLYADSEAARLLANMEEWRWMPADLGGLYVWNNIPDFTQRVVKDGKIVRTVRIVAGEIDKQTPIFSRPMRKITFRPTWIVPDSIKVHELWPDMLRGGSMMREWKLEVTTKDGAPMDWRKMNWSKIDIRDYEVIQPNGPKSVMGKVKFSFPNQHTVFMHDTLERDKWMFRSVRRTYSHGCMRVADPIGLAEIVLREDKGWDKAKVAEEVDAQLNNEIPLDRKVPVHMTYFTALVDESGTLHTFPDVYGHERRIVLALEGKWNQIVKGRNHLAPVELNIADAKPRHYAEDDSSEVPAWQRRERRGGGGFFESLLGGDGL
jgi:murein L,D-transpeptidase YcbB/YkuD